MYYSGTGLLDCGLICTARPDAPADTLPLMEVRCQMLPIYLYGHAIPPLRPFVAVDSMIRKKP